MFYIFKADKIFSDKSDFGGRKCQLGPDKTKGDIAYALEKSRWKSDAFRVTRYREPETTMERWQQMQPICIPSLKMREIHSVLQGGGGGGYMVKDKAVSQPTNR
jgi:hypothetical protein